MYTLFQMNGLIEFFPLQNTGIGKPIPFYTNLEKKFPELSYPTFSLLRELLEEKRNFVLITIINLK